MAFSDNKTLNAHLEEASYITGYTPSKADLSVFESLGKAPSTEFVHIARWYKHIASFPAGERQKWTGSAVPQVSGAKPTVADDDDDVDLFGSDDEEDTAAAEKLKADRVQAYNEKKSKKPVLIAKSSILFDVKPWDDETDMKQLEACVRAVQMEGLLWGASKLVPVGYGINKLQICSVIVDDMVSVDDIQEKIQENEDFVQSVDIAAFNKI